MDNFAVENNADIQYLSERKRLKNAKEKQKTRYSERPLQPQIRHTISM